MSLAEQLSEMERDERFVAEGSERQPMLPRFKTPITAQQLMGSERVFFEIDTNGLDSDDMLDDDDDDDDDDVEDSEYDKMAPVNSDPKRFVEERNRKKSTIENYLVDPTLSFDTFYDATEMEKMENLQEDGAVKKMIVQEGHGPQVPNYCKLFVHYVIGGDGISEPFDSTVLRGYPACIDFRSTELIPGLFIAIKSMKLYEVAKVWIRHDFAYGVIGCPPRIPPSLDVHCLVEILSLVEESQLKMIPFMTSKERTLLEFKEIENAALELRLIGNGEFNAASYWKAIKRYRKAIDILEDYSTRTQEDHNTRQGLLYTLYINLGASYLKVGRYQQVCVCCKMGLRCAESGVGFRNQDSDAKLYYRFAEAQLQLNNTTRAKSLNKEAKRRSPKDQNILDQEARINAQIRKENDITKIIYGKMGSVFNKSGETDSAASSSKNNAGNNDKTAND